MTYTKEQGTECITTSAFYLLMRAHDHVWDMRDVDFDSRMAGCTALNKLFCTEPVMLTVPAVVIDGRRYIEVHPC